MLRNPLHCVYEYGTRDLISVRLVLLLLLDKSQNESVSVILFFGRIQIARQK